MENYGIHWDTEDTGSAVNPVSVDSLGALGFTSPGESPESPCAEHSSASVLAGRTSAEERLSYLQASGKGGWTYFGL